MSEQMTFADGKYTVINDNGTLTALRNGEPWERDLVGDNLVYWMLVDSLALRSLVAELLPYAEAHIQNDLYTGGVCMEAELALLDKARSAVGVQ